MGIETSQGRLQDRRPVAVIDIGSNSIRMVIYEGVARSPTVLFNEKMLAGLGRGIVTTGELDPDGVTRAVQEFRRFRAICEQAGARSLHVVATAAAREAKNGPDFIRRAEEILGTDIQVLSGREEAHYSALGVISGFYKADGMVGDLGGGSLELVDVKGEAIGDGITLPLGGLRLREMAGGSLGEAAKIARREIARAPWLGHGEGRAFYCVGGTWRNLARLHMCATHYPLEVMHHYEMDPVSATSFLKRVARGDIDKMRGIQGVSKSRRALLPYGATVLLEIIGAAKPSRIVFSANGVREGYLYALLSEGERAADPLISAAEELALLRSRSVTHAHELAEWTGEAFAALGVNETENEARYRRAACLLADIGWRAHPEYRGTQSLNIIAHGSFIGIDHPGRAFIALTSLFRHEGLFDDALSPEMRELATPVYAERARLLGGLMRVIYLLSASMPGVIPRLKWQKRDDGALALLIPADRAALMGERPQGRMAQLAKLTGMNLMLDIARD
ncbi:exopolyphosphatase [Chelativorans sp. AA-79]|uniref:exopolyphosphatase n=1 Tax=Chelativorans sp. AA-79 TaxID=3028735 RepID=UPI0023F94C1A|nr:exopolyphosphatase [Chelativorans sp. AA-79]WEX07478.1 exopolyphosphatase [Chelativorans sp. AA-79]